MLSVYRYNSNQVTRTNLDPLEDLVSWISGLRSAGYVQDILRKKHFLTGAGEIRRCAQLISTYAENSVGLIEQAYTGSPALSFLPLYYSILNLSKIYLVCAGMRNDLAKNRYHGATYDPFQKSSRDILTEEVTLKPQGVLPLFYRALTGSSYGNTGRKVRLNDIYSKLYSVGHEFEFIYGRHPDFQPAALTVEGDTSVGFNLALTLIRSSHPMAFNRAYLKILGNLHKDTQRINTYIGSKVVAASAEEARDLFSKNIRRFLLYDVGVVHSIRRGQYLPYSVTVLSRSALLMPEELPIWIAFFHLSNIVRYNPEFLAKLMDSSSWALLLAMRKHCILRFLTLFWSNLHKSSFVLVHV